MKIKHLLSNFRFNRVQVLLLGSFCVLGLVYSQNSFAQGEPKTILDPKNEEEVHMIKGDLEAVKAYSLVRVSVSNPEIADIANADNDQVLMLAKKPGQCALFIWDEYGKRTVIIRVFSEDLDLVKTRVDNLLQKSEINGVKTEVNSYEGKVVLTGNLSAKKVEELDTLVQPFESSIINLVREEVIEDLVQIDVQIAELNATLAKNLGVDWLDAVNVVEGLAGTGLKTSSPTTVTGNTNVPFAEDSIFRVGKLRRTTSISAIINMVVTEGKGRVLSKPKLVVKSGKEASFLVGGEIPIKTTNTSSGGNTQENIEFKDFGISLTITPVIVGNNVDVTMSVEVSDIDPVHAVGENVAFSTRTAQTQLFLEDGQSVVLAGLIKHKEEETVSKVPFLGDIPIIGAVFRNRQIPGNQDTELVVSLTPTIIRQNGSTRAVDSANSATTNPTSAMSKTEPSVNATQPQPTTVAVHKDAPATPVVASAPAAPAPAAQPAATTAAAPAPVAAPAVASAPATTPAAASQVDPISMYTKTIQEKISEAIAYPFEAKEKGWQGTVKLTLHLMKDGSLANLDVKESSGYNIFDKDAMNTAQILAPYQAFPSDLKQDELIITVPIVYSQDSFSKENAASKQNQVAPNQSSKAFPVGQTYAEWIQKKIAQAVQYPSEAKENGWEGTVKLGLHILNDGTLAFATVKESSGYSLFDEQALKTAKDLAPYSGFPSESKLQELNVTVPIVYSLEKK